MSNENNNANVANALSALMGQLPTKAARQAVQATPISKPEEGSAARLVCDTFAAGQNGSDYMGGKIGTGTAAMHEVWLRAICLGRPVVTDREMTATLSEMGRMRPTRPHYAILIGKGLLVKDGAGYRPNDVIVAAITNVIAGEQAARDEQAKAEQAKAEKPKPRKARKGQKTAEAAE